MTPYQRLEALPRDARDTLFLLCVIAWVIAPQVGVLPVWVSLLAGGLLLWRGVLDGPPVARALDTGRRAARVHGRHMADPWHLARSRCRGDADRAAAGAQDAG